MSFTQVELAEMIATHAHRGVLDKVGVPYIEHPRWIVTMIGDQFPNLQAAAWLHDVVEDTKYTLDDLRTLGVLEEIVQDVDALTKRPGETRKDTIRRVKTRPGALHIKKFDNAHNSSTYRVQLLPKDKQARLVAKYERDRYWLYTDEADWDDR